jgi:hypothetical protein
LLIVSFLLASLNATYAQHKPVTFTLKGGLTISNIYSSSSTDISSDNYAGGPYQSTTGFFVEGTADVSIGKAWSLMPGLSLTGKGAEGPLEYPVQKMWRMVHTISIIKSLIMESI